MGQQSVNVDGVIVADRVDTAPSVEERRQAGRLARAHIPRSSQADWIPPDDRPDPVTFVREADLGRVAQVLPLRYARTAASPFAFLRRYTYVDAARKVVGVGSVGTAGSWCC